MKDTKVELKETELEAVSGGDVTSANIVGTVNQLRRPTAEVTPVGMPELNNDEKFRIAFRSDRYQLILSER